jgi:hypothetical protein
MSEESMKLRNVRIYLHGLEKEIMIFASYKKHIQLITRSELGEMNGTTYHTFQATLDIVEGL